LDVYEEFMKVWELKLKKWDSYFEEQEHTEFASDSEGSKGEAPTEAINSKGLHSKGEK
jgi:hypothetical protein